MDAIKWNRTWQSIDAARHRREAINLQNELLKELCASHPLFRLEPRIIGRCIASDDVVALLSDGRIAVIHLTWQGKPDQFPETYPSWDAFDTVEAFSRAIVDIAEGEDT